MIKERLAMLYPDQADILNEKVEALISKWKEEIRSSYPWVNEKDAVLITYGDAVKKEGEAPLKSLKTFADKHLEDCLLYTSPSPRD